MVCRFGGRSLEKAQGGGEEEALSQRRRALSSRWMKGSGRWGSSTCLLGLFRWLQDDK